MTVIRSMRVLPMVFLVQYVVLLYSVNIVQISVSPWSSAARPGSAVEGELFIH
jgi:hypothetical protein